MNAPVVVTDPETIYLGDNGRALCGAHLGATGRFTGRDLSGQALFPITSAVLESNPEAAEIACETCGRTPDTNVRVNARGQLTYD